MLTIQFHIFDEQIVNIINFKYNISSNFLLQIVFFSYKHVLLLYYVNTYNFLYYITMYVISCSFMLSLKQDNNYPTTQLLMLCYISVIKETLVLIFDILC